MGGDHQVGRCGFASRGFDARGCFLLGLPSSWLGICCGFRLRLLRPGRLPGGGHFRLLRNIYDLLRRGFWDWGWSAGGLDNTPSSDDVIPPLAQAHLLGRGTVPLSFRGGRVACGALSGLLGRLLCKSCLRFFPLDTAPVVRSVVAPAATALRLFSRGRARHTRRTWVRIRIFAACVRSAGSACISVGLLGPRKSPPTLAVRRVR